VGKNCSGDKVDAKKSDSSVTFTDSEAQKEKMSEINGESYFTF
jgi:hypothetical protein